RSDRDWSSDVCSSDLSSAGTYPFLLTLQSKKGARLYEPQHVPSTGLLGLSKDTVQANCRAVANTRSVSRLLQREDSPWKLFGARSEEHTSELQSRSDL